jgi:SAM-dependent methyltransferase
MRHDVEVSSVGAPSPATRLSPGGSTATPTNVDYRLGKLLDQGILSGEWLDCGCADGGYSIGLLERGAKRVVGLEVLPERVAAARARCANVKDITFVEGESERLPFPDATFDGVLLNEVLEHVDDEHQTLVEARRVLRPGGHLALFSPNRWFPFEGHGLTVRGRAIDFPVPYVPWLPEALTRPHLNARNYWPRELRRLVIDADFAVEDERSVFPVLEVYPWLPAGAIEGFRAAVPSLERIPFVRRFGVSTLIVARA